MIDFVRDWEPTPIGLYAWDAPRSEETAQGLLLRLAEMHAHTSTERTAGSLGINRSRLAHGYRDQLEKFAAGIHQQASAFVADSPQRDEKAQLCVRGQPITDYLMFGVRRLCPGCLAESMHHRFWWDIRPITTCPRHGLNLIDACVCGAKFNWRGGGLVHCSTCGNQDLVRLPCVKADAAVLRADAYLLSRFAAGQSEAVPILDSLSLTDVFVTLERIGAACDGYSYEWQSAKSLGVPRGVLQARGFAVLADGKLDEVLTRIYDGFIAKGGRPEEGFTSCYGWLYHWFNHKRGVKFSPLLAEVFLHHGAARFPIVPKARLGLLPRAARRKFSLKEAAKICDTSVFAMKNIGLALGIIRTEKKSGSQLSFPAETVKQIAADLKGARSLGETQALLGVGHKVVHALMNVGALVPALKGGRKHKHIYIFRPDDVDALLEAVGKGAKSVKSPSPSLVAISHLGRGRWSTVAECVRSILDGRMKVRERVAGLAGLKALYIDHAVLGAQATRSVAGAGIPLAAATRKMRLNARGMSKAIAIGLLPGVEQGARAIPAGLVHSFARRFMMLGEIREHIPGYFPTLKDTLERMGFKPDPDLEKCLHAGYPRQQMEAFLAKVASGKVSLEPPDAAREEVISRTRDLLARAKAPIPSDGLLQALRRQIKLGPSDQDQFFFATMWEEKAEFVFIIGAGWWLRRRAYLGRTWPADAKAASHHEIVEQAVIEMLRQAKAPLTQSDVIAALDRKAIPIAAADKIVFLRKLVAKRRDVIAKLTGLGYWDRSRPYPPAQYDPKTCPTGVQSAFDRIGLFVLRHLEETGRPGACSGLATMLKLKGDGAFRATGFDRGYLARALAGLPNDIVYLRGHGYWLKRRPWSRADYNPVRRKTAA
jgi:hypothetical protein